MSDTLERVKKATASLLKIEAENIADDARFVEDLGADSMQSIELVASFEEEFDIELDEDEALKVKTVSDAANFVDNLLQKK
ncbi:MAG TPA: acyl carrier protein [Spirochaetota bacterium]|nr:acyl carrier protein [Spirochaetota bacterium]